MNMGKLYYSVTEVAAMLGESASLVRFWTKSFEAFLKPRRTNHGNRCYTDDEIETLKQIHYLLRDQGMTHEGAINKMKADRRAVSDRVKAINHLKAVKAQLEEIKSSL